jgi:hypothetical protein
MQHAKNSDRRDAIKNGDYLDPFQFPEEILKKTFVKLVVNEKQRYYIILWQDF